MKKTSTVVIGRRATNRFNMNRALVSRTIPEKEVLGLVRGARRVIGAFEVKAFAGPHDPLEESLRNRGFEIGEKANDRTCWDFRPNCIAIEVLTDEKYPGKILGYEIFTLKPQRKPGDEIFQELLRRQHGKPGHFKKRKGHRLVKTLR